MRSLALAALLIAGLAGPAAAAIDLGPIRFGLSNGISSAPVEQTELGLFVDEFEFTITDAPRDTVWAEFRAFSDDPDAIRRKGLFLFVGAGFTFIPLGGGGVGVFQISSEGAAFRLQGTALALPASYTVSVRITPLPLGALLLTTALAGLAVVGIRPRPRGQSGTASNEGAL